MIKKEFGIDFHSSGGALTLPVCAVTDTKAQHGTFTRTHSDDWTITGEVKEGFYVNFFRARHPKFGYVWGDFESFVEADSEEGFADFWKQHEPEAWDYDDL